MAYSHELQYIKPGTCIQVQIQKISTCANVSMTSELFIVSHCVYLVLQTKKGKNKTPDPRAYKYTVWRWTKGISYL